MVGHCGKIKPAIEAIETVDAAVGRIVAALEKVGGRAIITADHGNAEEMLINTKTGQEASTKHSINPVPCILFDPAYDGSYSLRQPSETDDLMTKPGLSHLASTLLMLMGQDVPDDLQAPLIQFVRS